MRLAARGLPSLLALSVAHAANLPSLDPALGTIFPAEKAHELLRQTCLRVPANVTGSWTPAGGEIRELEARLPEALANANPNWMQHPGVNFARQYGGIEINGRRLIYINAFPAGLTVSHMEGMPPSYKLPDWHTHAIAMCDSGAVFGAEYDPKTRAFSDFEFEVPFR